MEINDKTTPCGEILASSTRRCGGKDGQSSTPATAPSQKDSLSKLRAIGYRIDYYPAKVNDRILALEVGEGKTLAEWLDGYTIEQLTTLCKEQRQALVEGKADTTLADRLMMTASEYKFQDEKAAIAEDKKASAKICRGYWDGIIAKERAEAEADTRNARIYANSREELVREYKAIVENEKDKRKLLPSAELSSIANAISSWMMERKKPGIMLNGQYGSGKTTWMKAIVNVLRKHGEPVMITSADDVAMLLKRDDMALDAIRDKPWLAIDDLGKEPYSVKSYGTDMFPMAKLISYRYSRGLPCIITTNEGDQLRNIYTEYIYGRIVERCEIINVNTQNYRY